MNRLSHTILLFVLEIDPEQVELDENRKHCCYDMHSGRRLCSIH